MADETDDISDRVTVAGEALDALADGPAQRAADAIGAAFRAAGAEIEDTLVKAARTGELSFQSLAASAARDISGMALDRYLRAPLSTLIGGGLVDGALGALMPASGAPPVTITMNVPAATPDLHRSGAQIAAAAGRAAARAMRRF